MSKPRTNTSRIAPPAREKINATPGLDIPTTYDSTNDQSLAPVPNARQIQPTPIERSHAGSSPYEAFQHGVTRQVGDAITGWSVRVCDEISD